MKTIIATALAIIVALGLGWYLISNNTAPTDTAAISNTMPVPGTQTPEMQVTQTAPMKVAVTYGPTGFSPSSVTIPKGGTVVFTAAPGADEMWVASAPHPTHEGYDGTTRAQHCTAGYSGPAPFDQCSAGTSFTFTFDKVGTWKYHNHGNTGDYGTVIVQ
jgi:plastocyanin